MLAAADCDENGWFGGICRLPVDRAVSGRIRDVVAPVAVFFVVYVVGRVLRHVVDGALVRTRADPQITTLVHNVTTATVIVVAVLGAAAAAIGLSVILTVGGLASLAIGLAFQDLLRNILAGIFLLIEHPFRIGDVISVGSLTGTVQTIELRTTTLRLADGRLAVMPNLTAFTSTVVNASASQRRRHATSVRLEAGGDLERAIRAARGVLESADELLEEPAPSVRPRLEPDGAVTLECRYWIDTSAQDGDAVTAALFRRLYAAMDAGRPTTAD